MSTPSFIDRIRSRSRRPEQVSLLDAAIAPVMATSPGPLVELDDDHWHAGDPRLVPGGTALLVGEVPSPRRPVDRRGLHVVPEVDLRGGVVDLRGAQAAQAATTPAEATSPPGPQPDAPCAETSTWLG